MDDKSPNFVLVDLTLDRPSLREFRALRRMGIFTVGEPFSAVGFPRRHSAIETVFISQAFTMAANEAARCNLISSATMRPQPLPTPRGSPAAACRRPTT